MVDILANIRRGGGIVFYKNIGSAEEPLFRSLQENQRIVESEHIGQYFDVIDVDQDGTVELITYAKNDQTANVLTVLFNEGDYQQPQWKPIIVTTPQGDSILAPDDVHDTPRLTVGDWNQDGKLDLIIGIEACQ